MHHCEHYCASSVAVTMYWFIAVFLVLHSTSAGIFDGPQLSSFNYKECTTPFHHPGLLNFKDLKIHNTRLGNWKLSGKAELFVPVVSPVQAEVHLERKIWGVPVPMVCIDNFGSCTYPDLCDLGAPLGTRCPAKLENRNYPCRCPFPAGRYNIPGLVFPFSSAMITSRLFGTHYGRITISQGDQALACYEFTTRMT